MNFDAVQSRLAGLPLGGLRVYPSVGSTNDEARRWAEAGAADLALVVADEQTAGRGRLDRRWLTPPSSALAFSLVLRPGKGFPVAVLGRLSALGALAVSDALQEDLGLPVQVKWPNDVLIRGRKTSGILAEAYWQGSRLDVAVLGIGVNVTPASVPPPGEVLYPATCVEAELGRPVDRIDLLRLILARLIDWRSRLASDEFLGALESRLAFRGERVQVLAGAGGAPAVQAGVLLGLEADGSLRLRTDGGEIVNVQSGDLRLRPAAPAND